jgi:hypothetical protein
MGRSSNKSRTKRDEIPHEGFKMRIDITWMFDSNWETTGRETHCDIKDARQSLHWSPRLSLYVPSIRHWSHAAATNANTAAHLLAIKDLPMIILFISLGRFFYMGVETSFRDQQRGCEHTSNFAEGFRLCIACPAIAEHDPRVVPRLLRIYFMACLKCICVCPISVETSR